MMKLSKALMLSVSGLMFTSGGSLAYAGISTHDLTSFNSPGTVTFVHTHITHASAPEERLLSSLEDFDKDNKDFKPSPTSGSVSVAEEATLSRCGHFVCNAHFALLPLAHELTNSRLSLKISPPEIFSASSPKTLGREEKRQSDNKLIQLAATCFVTDTSACSGNEFGGNNGDNEGHGTPGGPNDDYDLDNGERCRQEGYNQTSCPEGQEPVNICPYDSDYFEKCVSSCPSNYVTCEVPYYGVGEACDGKYASCKKDTERACKELNPGYVNSCGTGQRLSDDRCSYDNAYGTCCNTCAGYDYTSIPDGYVQNGNSCTGCDGQEYFKIKPNPCDGFLNCGSMGPEAGAKTCLSGTTTLYDNCKSCPYECSLSSCPSPYTCKKEECSNMYCKTGCQSGYDWNASTKTCTKQCAYECTYSSCPSPFTCRYEDCSGKYCKTGCQSGYDWNASSKTCTKQCTPLPSDSNCSCFGTRTESDGCGGTRTVCNVPDLKYLYSDKTLSADIISGKTIVGISIEPENRLAVGLGYTLDEWGGYGTDIPTLENISWVGRGVYVCGERSMYEVRDGKANTQTILAYGKSSGISYPAAEWVNSYQPTGCSAGSWCGAGNWFIPSTWQAFAYFNNRDKILSMLEAINQLPDDWMYTQDGFYTMTSNEISATEPGFLYFNQGAMARSDKTFQQVSLPFIEY